MKLSVVGVGYVGLVTGTCFAEAGNHVICVDSDESKIAMLKNGQTPIYESGLTELLHHNTEAGRLEFTTDLAHAVANSEIVFLAVGTPSADDGSADISAVLDAARQIAQCMDGYRVIATKSTVPVGTHARVCEVMREHTSHKFDYVSNPEFLKEGSAVDDFLKPDRVIIGADNPAILMLMKHLYTPFMRRSNRIILMDPASAEMAKYAANAMLATRISFMNELSALCDAYGANVDLVRSGLGSDSRIGNAFLFAGVGFGGSCFPKDVRALIHMGQQKDCPQTIVEAVQRANIAQHERFARRVLSHFGEGASNVTIAAWGLAFKAKTDDVRESPALYCIRQFTGAGMKVRAFDPAANRQAVLADNDAIQLVDDGYDALDGADALVIFTDWQEFRTPDFDAIAQRLKKPVIFDGRNLYDPEFVRMRGIEYHSIGRPERTPENVA